MRRLLYAMSIMFFWIGTASYQFSSYPYTVGISQLINPFHTSPQNIKNITQLGYGSIQTLTWTNTDLYVQTSAGIWKYEDPTNMRVNMVPQPLQDQYSGPVIAETFTDRGGVLVTQYARGQVEETNIASGESRRWAAHSDTIISAAVNPITQLMAVARSSLYPFELLSGDDFDIKVWDLTSGEERFTLRGHTGMITALSFSADGQQLASTGNDGTVRVWDMSNGEQILELQGHAPVTFGADNILIFTQPNQIILYHLNSRQIVQSAHVAERTLALAIQGQLLAIGDDKGHISIYDLRTMTPEADWNAHSAPITSIEWAPNGLFLATATQGELKVWGIAPPTLTADLSGFTLPIHDVVWATDATVISNESNYLSGKIRAWNPYTGEQIWDTQSGFSSDKIVVGPNDTLLISNWNDVEMLNQDKLSDRTTIYEGREIRAIALGQSTLSIASYNWIDIVNLTTQHQTLHLEGHKEPINALAFNTDGTLLASGSGIVPFDVIPPEIDHSTRLWDPASGNEVAVLLGADSPVLSLAFSPDNHWLASGHDDGTIEIWDVSSRTLHLSWRQSDAVEALAFHPDSTVLASGSRDNRISLWAVDTNQPLGTLQGNMGAITSLAFDPTGQYLASSSLDGTVRIWGVQSQ